MKIHGMQKKLLPPWMDTSWMVRGLLWNSLKDAAVTTETKNVIETKIDMIETVIETKIGTEIETRIDVMTDLRTTKAAGEVEGDTALPTIPNTASPSIISPVAVAGKTSKTISVK